ncbi:ABC-type polysaccharide transport system permease subunit [Kribbella aluminosa]|uniref:ABC-type polysaccharide transport system permease subunit n=1 Tax=Kribbella aluminosa TaxID=416017 RepID=A0ABS4UWW2_9ACTN|nr:ABC transporter permease subunit [Kribbella aluminosa]MBP2356116.1 ABC-type polysaccharide transport system permease subunit [Kribbella aluminosa]
MAEPTTNFVDTLRVDDNARQRRRRRVKPQLPLATRILRAWRLYVLLAPALIWVLVFCYWPMYGVQIAFRDFSPATGLTGGPWVGFEHFTRFVTSYQFGLVLKNTLILHLYELAVGFPAPIILALVLNAVRQKYFSRAVQLITYAPNFISVVVVVGIMVMLLDPQAGAVNSLVNLFGAPSVNFMGQAGWFRHLYVFSGVWQTAGFSAIIYLAALSSVPPELHEAARVDGASRLRRIWHLDLPAILPIAVILLILNIGNILNVGFEKVLLMQNPLNLDVSQVIGTYVYQVGLKAPIPQYSYATAIGLFNSVVGVLLLVIVNQMARRIAKAGLF